MAVDTARIVVVSCRGGNTTNIDGYGESGQRKNESSVSHATPQF
jgi:hypothetical protein